MPPGLGIIGHLVNYVGITKSLCGHLVSIEINVAILVVMVIKYRILVDP